MPSGPDGVRGREDTIIIKIVEGAFSAGLDSVAGNST